MPTTATNEKEKIVNNDINTIKLMAHMIQTQQQK